MTSAEAAPTAEQPTEVVIGVRFRELPMRPDRIIAALAAKRESEPLEAVAGS